MFINIHPSSSVYLGMGHVGSILSRDSKTSHFPATSFSLSRGTPSFPRPAERCNLPQHVLGLLGAFFCWDMPKHLTQEAS